MLSVGLDQVKTKPPTHLTMVEMGCVFIEQHLRMNHPKYLEAK